MSLSLIFSRCLSKLPGGNVLVNGSGMLFVDAIVSTEMSPLDTIPLTRWNFRSICFPLQWFLGSLALATAPLLSQKSRTGSCMFGMNSISLRNSWSQAASLATSQAITYSSSMVVLVMQDFLILLHIMAPLRKVKIAPQVDLWEFLFDWKSKLVSPVGIKSPLEYTSI